MVAVLALVIAIEAPFRAARDIMDVFANVINGVATLAARSPMDAVLALVMTILAQAGASTAPLGENE